MLGFAGDQTSTITAGISSIPLIERWGGSSARRCSQETFQDKCCGPQQQCFGGGHGVTENNRSSGSSPTSTMLYRATPWSHYYVLSLILVQLLLYTLGLSPHKYDLSYLLSFSHCSSMLLLVWIFFEPGHSSIVWWRYCDSTTYTSRGSSSTQVHSSFTTSHIVG